MTFAYARPAIAADFFTIDYRLSCQVNVPAGGLNALLIDPLNSYLELEDAYISRINSPGVIVAHYEQAAIRKEHILFIVLARREDGVPPKGSGSFVQPVPREALVTLPSFEIRGTIETEAKAKPREILVQIAGRFLPVHEATATVARNPDISIGGKLIMINRERIEVLSINQ